MLVLLLLSACTGSVAQLECDNRSVVGTITAGPQDGVFRGSAFPVSGTATTDGIAIRSITVGGVPARPGSTSFGTWSVDIPMTTLQTLAVPSTDADAGEDDGEVTLSATAIDACGLPHPIGEDFTIQVDLSPDTVIDRLTLDRSIPGGASFIPVDGTTPAVLTLTANPSARNALVTLSTSLGALSPGASVVLGGDGASDATATLLVYGDSPDDAGTALITATAEDFLASTTVALAGGPTLYPDAAALRAEGSQVVTATSDGDIASCSAFTATPDAFTATVGTTPILGTTVEDDDGDGQIQITVAHLPGSTADATLQLSCCDRYHQCTGVDEGLYTFTAAAQAE
jgi:hypothetical protein